MAELKDLAEAQVTTMTAATLARQQRQQPNRRVVQKGGVLTAARARHAIDARVEREAEKVAKKAARDYKASREAALREAASQLAAWDSTRRKPIKFVGWIFVFYQKYQLVAQ